MKWKYLPGLIIILTTPYCKKNDLPPFAVCEIYPAFGDTTVLFEIDAGKSQNHLGFQYGLSFRWDFNDDGKWDTQWRSESMTNRYFTTPGTHKIVVEVADFAGSSDTTSVVIETFGRNRDLSTMQDPRDGKIYSIAKFKGNWWMRENLKYGKVIDPCPGQSDNKIVEQYYGFYWGSSDTIIGIYDWREAMNYNYNKPQGICPPGWHIPSISEWKILLKDLPYFYALRFYGEGGFSELNLYKGFFLFSSCPDVTYYNVPGWYGFWANDYKKEDSDHIYVGSFRLSMDENGQHGTIAAGYWPFTDQIFYPDLILGMAVRCIKEE
jgi:uncharacterized protein (TIGR02145 family)